MYFRILGRDYWPCFALSDWLFYRELQEFPRKCVSDDSKMAKSIDN